MRPVEQAESLTISDVDALRALSDPLRMRLVELLIEPRAAKELAALLNIPQTRLYYHLGLLEKHGLIHVVEERVVSGIVEKRYRIAAKNLKIDRALLSMNASDAGTSGEALVTSMLHSAASDIQRGLASGTLQTGPDASVTTRLLLARTIVRLKQADAEAFYERLAALLQEYDGRHEQTDDLKFSLTVALYPVVDDAPMPSDAASQPDGAAPRKRGRPKKSHPA
jgi:DNA-binding transcriptional ArsR family regulator